MPRRIPPVLWLAPPLAFFLYFYHLTAFGLIGPDEPRYAAVSRAMAAGGDWITPRLWGVPWFEKPALLYWMQAAAFRLGLGPELAPRLPVALMAVAFLAFFWWILDREFGCLPARFATGILGTTAVWIVASQVGTTDLPLAATYSAAMLLALPWVRRRDESFLPVVAGLLGLAVLAKGPVAVALACPLLLPWKAPFWSTLGRNIVVFLRPRAALPFLAVTLPWYLLCAHANGAAFLQDFLWKHNVERFLSSTAVGYHGKPFWYFVEILPALLLPWTPLVPLAARRSLYADPGRKFLLVWAALWLVFFSQSANKLPLYILPMIPAVATLLGTALAETRRAAPWLAACALLLVAFPLAVPLLPTAATSTIFRAPVPPFHWTWLLPIAVAAIAWTLEARRRRVAALASIVTAAVIGTALLKYAAAPDLDRLATGRIVHAELDTQRSNLCYDWTPRGMEYSLDYYFDPPLPRCAEHPQPLWLHQLPGQLPVATPKPAH